VSPDNVDPVQFYYDFAHFRADEAGKTRLEVYLGVPHRYGRFQPETGETRMQVERIVGLLDEEAGAVYRRRGELRHRAAGDVSGAGAGFVPDVVSLDVPPGLYRMEVEVVDRHTGRKGRYRQLVPVDDYTEPGLLLSELQLAWRVTANPSPGRFGKGELEVVPIPSRTIGTGQGIFVYYEIYNLSRDAFGQTRYRVEYTVSPRKGGSSRGIITQLVKVLSSDRQEVAVGYDQLGHTDSERAYTELDLARAEPGKHYLTVTVTDLNSKETQSRKATFLVAE
jgi:hypothetical protein